MNISSNALRPSYSGEGGALFKIAIVTTILTIVTLGFYRFWAKTRIRRYLWSSIQPANGAPLEYLGTGLEKFLGFLIAVAFLAVYLGLFQLFLTFIGISIIPQDSSPQAQLTQSLAINLSFLALLPFIFYAQYRARRYMLSRTRWRGIRFGAEKAAWGYVWRALGHTALTVITLGILLPRQTFWLEKYKIDRTWYGSAKMTQNGNWKSLYAAMKHVFIGIGVAILGGILIAMGTGGLGGFIIAVGYIWFLIGTIDYGIKSWSILAREKVLGENIRFESTPRTAFVLGTYVVATLAMAVVAIVMGLVGAALFGAFSFQFDLASEVTSMDPWRIIVAVVTYLIIFGAIGALSVVLITQPIVRHFTTETAILNVEELDNIVQRSQDDFAEADGFADALDIGAGI